MKFNIQYHFLALSAIIVVVGLRWGDIRGYAAWSKGTATAQAEIDDIASTRQIRIIKYSFAVDGTGYSGETASRTGFVEGGRTTATYAISDPNVSTLQPENMRSIYVNSIAISSVASAPFVIMCLLELVHALKRRGSPSDEADA